MLALPCLTHPTLSILKLFEIFFGALLIFLKDKIFVVVGFDFV